MNCLTSARWTRREFWWAQIQGILKWQPKAVIHISFAKMENCDFQWISHPLCPIDSVVCCSCTWPLYCMLHFLRLASWRQQLHDWMHPKVFRNHITNTETFHKRTYNSFLLQISRERLKDLLQRATNCHLHCTFSWIILESKLSSIQAMLEIFFGSIIMYYCYTHTCRECKNRYIFVYLKSLVDSGVFQHIFLNFLPKGHTQYDIDQVFLQISVFLKGCSSFLSITSAMFMSNSLVFWSFQLTVKHILPTLMRKWQRLWSLPSQR